MASPKEKSNLETKVDQELDDLLASLGSEVTTVKLYRIEGGKQQALATYTPSELAANPEEIIGGEYGPGRYLVRAVLPTLPGKPGNRWGPSKVIDLAEDSQYVQVYMRKHAADPEPVSQQDPWYRMMELQLKLSEQRAADMDKRLGQQNDQFHQLILAMINRKDGGGNDITSLIAGVRDLKALSDGAGGGNTNGSRLTELKELFEIAELLKDRGPDESPWATLSKVLTARILQEPAPAAPPDPKKLIVESTETRPSSPKVTMAPEESPKPAMPAANAKLDDASSSKPVETSVVKNPDLPLIARLQKKAQKGRDPELWADWSMEQADDESDEEALHLVEDISKSPTSTAWWAVFSSKITAPGVVAHAEIRAWWETFYQRVKEVIKENAPAAGAAGGVS